MVPISFQEFQLLTDEVYSYKDRTIELYPLLNDSLRTEFTLSYNNPAVGELVPDINGEGTMGYKPLAGYAGLDSLTYQVCTESTCKTAKIRLIIESPADPTNCTTMLQGESVETKVNTPIEIRPFMNDVLCFEYMFGGISVDQPEHGVFYTVQYNEHPKSWIYIYHPNKNFRGQDEIRYRYYTNPNLSTYIEATAKITVR